MRTSLIRAPQRRARHGRAALPLLLALGACGQADSSPGPGGVTVGEARALDAAAAMLDARQVPEEALRPTAAEAAPDATASGQPAS